MASVYSVSSNILHKSCGLTLNLGIPGKGTSNGQMRSYVSLGRPARISSTETRNTLCPAVSFRVYECFTIAPCLTQALLSVSLLSHDYCFKFFLWLQITAWHSSVHGRTVHTDRLSKKAKAADRVLYLCSEVHKIIVSNLVQAHEVPWMLDDFLKGNKLWTC